LKALSASLRAYFIDLRGSLCRVLRHYLGGSLNAAQIALKTDNGSI